MTFEPRVKLGREIAPLASAMIDLSDGLSRDLGHICRASGVGAVIEESLVPVHGDAVELSRRDGVSVLEHALNDGEDYELLFTSARDVSPGIRIGKITSDVGIFLRAGDGELRKVEARGWEHGIGS
jgi:thiamine-monophosphate kinase